MIFIAPTPTWDHKKRVMGHACDPSSSTAVKANLHSAAKDHPVDMCVARWTGGGSPVFFRWSYDIPWPRQFLLQ